MSSSNLNSPETTAPARRVFSHQKTARVTERTGLPLEQSANGVWHVRDYDLAKTILLSSDTRQSGFQAELMDDAPGIDQKPVLFQDGPEHHAQRKEIGRFFSPTTARTSYQAMMEDYADQMIDQLVKHGTMELSELSMSLAVRVAAEVVGLTGGDYQGLARRLNRFFGVDLGEGTFSWHPRQLANLLKTNFAMFDFYMRDVRPAIRARRVEPREDVISHLIAQNYNGTEILIECITYGAAGMVTTREFIMTVTWHMLENPGLREIYLNAPDQERRELLEEILRLEPVVSNLSRRATADMQVEVGDDTVTIKEGDLIDLHIVAVNTDPSVVGQDAHAICPGRPLEKRAQPPVMGFGFGPHRCPGAYIAIEETDIFVRKLLALDKLRLVSKPTIRHNDLIKSYEIRNFWLTAI